MMGKKLCPKVILEGTRLTHKTDIAFRLNEHPGFVGPRKYRYHSPLVSAEWCGFSNVPWGRGLINFDQPQEAMAMETYQTWMRLFELLQYYSWIVDRFHISTIAYQKRARDVEIDFGWLETRLVKAGFRLVLCTRSEASFGAARRERLKVSGNPSQYDDLSPFVAEQEAMLLLAAQSRLPWLELDVSDGDVDAAADGIVKWLGATDGLHLATS